MSDALRVAAHAKVNLFLRVFARETGGYHGVETALALLELCDELEFERTAAGIELEVTGADLGKQEDNLAYRAAQAVLKSTGGKFGVRMRLTKHIPAGAGLGGGSADAAAALHAVNRLAENAVPPNEILQLAAKLGSDVPFLASGMPMALAWHRGERLFRIVPPSTTPVLLVCPATAISTADAYGYIDEERGDAPRGAVTLDSDSFASWGGIGRLGGNDFEGPIFGKHPDIRELFERLAETRPLMVRMTGSGSALFAAYKSDAERDQARAAFSSEVRTIPTTTRNRPPAPPAS